MNSIADEILERMKLLEIDCPNCEGLVDDEQYTCTVCWCQGGNGKINVFSYLLKLFTKI